MSITIERISKLADLRPHRDAWNALAQATPMAQFFQSYDWFAVYWKNFGADQQMEVRLVFDGEQLLGIVPLVLRHEPRRIGKLSVLTFPLDDWGSFFGPISHDPQRTMKAVIEHLVDGRKDWDILSWRWLNPQAAASLAIAEQMSAKHLRTFAATRCTTALIDLPRTWDEYLASRTGKFRNNLRRWRKRIEEIGELRYEKFRPAIEPSGVSDPRWDLYDHCERLAAKSWQGSSHSGTTLSHESIRPFLREVHQAAVGLGAVDLNLLYLDDQPVAFEYGYCWQGYKYSLRFGYNHHVSQAGIGNVMWLDAIQASILRGDHTFDMGPGSLDYKHHYLTRTADCQTLDHYRQFAPKAQAIALKQVLQSWWNAPAAVS